MSKTATPRGKPMSPLNEELRMTPEQVRQDLVDQGLDPEAEIKALRRIGQVMETRFSALIQRESMEHPFLGKQFPMFEEAVAAGTPAWAESPSEPHMASLIDVIGGADTKTTVWVRVSGWSMRDAGINDGDTLLVDTLAEPNDGDMVVVHINGQGQLVKRIKRTGQTIELVSAHPDFATIVIDDLTTLKIQGVVKGRVGTV